MDGFPPIILIASVSLHERRRVEAMLKATGFTTVGVGDAREAERELEAMEGTALLVIDAGLLEATHDAQWRDLRLRRPELGAVVRRVVPDQKSVQRWDSHTLVVPPGEAEGLQSAVDLLAAAALRPPVPVRPIRGERVPAKGDTPPPLRVAAGCS
jgi:hypothetical protein